MKDKPKCLRPECKRKAHCRGLCQSCYNQAGSMVRSKLTTWDELVANGKCLVPRHNHTYKGSSATAWLLAKPENNP